jgi:hypothetical protein
MFEVIISGLRTGQVKRKQFGTREEAERYLARSEEKLLAPKPNRRDPDAPPRIPSLRNYRLEILYRQPAPVAQAQPETRKAA